MKPQKNHLISWVCYAASLKIKPNDPLKLIFESIHWDFIYSLTDPLYANYGVTPHDPVSLFKAQLAIYLGEARSDRDLAGKLTYDGRLCYLCGFDYLKTPDHSTFTNFRNRLGDETFYKIFRNIIAQAVAIGVIHGIDFAVDSTHIHAYSNPRKPNPSDKDAAWGYKSEDYAFFGYKIHMIVDVKSQLPVEITVTPGNEHDSTQALPLLKSAKHIDNLPIQNFAADAAYDDYEIYRASINDLGLTPFIALNPRSSKDRMASSLSDLSFSYKQGCFCCAAGKPAVFAGYDRSRNRFKFRCPAAAKHTACLFKAACYKSEYGRTFYLFPEDDLRLVGKIIRGSRTWQINYARRPAVERCNSESKLLHSLDNLRVRGIAKVKIHAYLSVSAMILKKIALALPQSRSPAYAFA